MIKKFVTIMIIVLGMFLLCDGSYAEASTKVSLSKKKVTLTVGKTKKLKLSGANDVTWKSSDKKIATVSKSGKITAKSVGKCTITATYAGKNYTCKVTVKAAKTVTTKERDFDKIISGNNPDDYMTNGRFDYNDFGWYMGASEYTEIVPGDFIFIFGNWYVQTGALEERPGSSFITIGKWDTSLEDRWNYATYSYVFETGETIDTLSGSVIPKESVAYLPLIIKAMKANPDPNVAPIIDGITFKPCKYDDALVQY
ncbi:MAG: Ig-like domain-containing protein [Lachnospiraceae bacterium]|nr:Ig-like domain-containing protein [Lachnospiraceae bacterium]